MSTCQFGQWHFILQVGADHRVAFHRLLRKEGCCHRVALGSKINVG